jgi:hypothetical protein
MKIRVIVKRLKNPRVKRRLKIFLSVLSSLIVSGLILKAVYDIGYFDAKSLEHDKIAELSNTVPMLTTETAQRILAGALKEDPSNPTTVIKRIIKKNDRLWAVIVENNKIKKVGWILDMQMFFLGDLYNEDGYDLNEGIEKQYEISRDNFNLGVQALPITNQGQDVQ